MPVVGLRQLTRETRQVIERLEQDGEPVVITRHGRPIAALTPVSEQQAASLALAVVPEYVESRERAARAIASNEGTPASQLLAEFEIEDESLGGRENVFAEIEKLDIPSSLVMQVVGVASRGMPVALATPAIEMMNVELAGILMRDSLISVFERVRTVNENIVAEVAGAAGNVSVNEYANKLRDVTDVERLASRSTDT